MVDIPTHESAKNGIIYKLSSLVVIRSFALSNLCRYMPARRLGSGLDRSGPFAKPALLTQTEGTTAIGTKYQCFVLTPVLVAVTSNQTVAKAAAGKSYRGAGSCGLPGRKSRQIEFNGKGNHPRVLKASGITCITLRIYVEELKFIWESPVFNKVCSSKEQ